MNLKRSSYMTFMLVAGLTMLMSLSGCVVQHVDTTSAIHYFPVGTTAADAETAWKVEWTFEPHPQSPGEYIWEITSVDFMRGRKTIGDKSTEDWIRVLDRVAVAAMFVPYVENGARYRDFYTYYTGLSQLDDQAVSRLAYQPVYIHDGPLPGTGSLVRETTEDFVRWIETGPGGYHAAARLKRGQVMTIWGMFSAVNYVYPVAFRFRDDGVIQVRIAASGQNLSSQPSNTYSHLHMGAWRLEPHLCARSNSGCRAEDVIVQKVSRRPVGSQEKIIYEQFGQEGGEDWLANEFTTLLLSNPSQPNGRPIKCASDEEGPCTSNAPIGYALVPIRYGAARYKSPFGDEGFLDHELWVTRKPYPPALAEIFYTEIHNYANAESLAGHRKVVWHKSAYNHIPRFEDLGFGSDNSFSKNNGVAITNYTGFDLVPRNLMFRTPTYTPKSP